MARIELLFWELWDSGQHCYGLQNYIVRAQHILQGQLIRDAYRTEDTPLLARLAGILSPEMHISSTLSERQ